MTGRTRPVAIAAAVLAAAVVLALLFRGSGLAVSMLTQIAWLAIVLLANNLLLGQCGLLSFGHAVQVGAGALASIAAMRWGAVHGWMPLPLVPLCSGLAAMVVALPLAYVATRSAGTAFAMVTLALGELAAALALMLPEWFGGEAGLTADRVYGHWLGLDFASPRQVCGLALAYALAAGLALYGLQRTALGRLFNAVRDNPERAAFLGHDPRRLRWLAYALAGFFAGVGGALGAVQFEIVSAPDALGLARSGSYLLFTYLGGSAHFLGPVLGSVLMVLASTLLAQWSAAWPLYLGLAFLLTVMFAPGGVAGLIAAAPGAVVARGWPRCASALAGALALTAGGIAAVEMAYRLHAAEPAWAWWPGRTLDPAAPLAWGCACALLVAGAGLLAAARLPAGQGARR
ncbi:branched-chain amino acid ABC transporter permease [Xylophilus rhododendri]|uniref:Branched-chain amino acid ABC transporter permease n=1 Tax=Xylophilus rhododendri TaxID=2697032 RepID=A0A857J0A9_9BURK|nr:branched-chain amino acid ABC transporter permease [Xylophilus rhododendri]QHI96541.1 branched-chain amino acid ABC transporter permease [Xylophilus rhododendri]